MCERADSKKENMGLTSWEGEEVKKSEIKIAKNYLIKEELEILNRIVSVYLDVA
ncbi:RhuM family protein [Pseudostreptobacillus hongkongensis]|uniref:RhuM family protein n=1 Tax=Pseudostreptobacillus hongkongensis TaxID=1162717 RepID=UPI00248115B1|nr:RhuM family protein [Pseudostreptobacillus hongkongensis]